MVDPARIRASSTILPTGGDHAAGPPPDSAKEARIWAASTTLAT